MTNTLAIVLGALFTIAVVIDAIVFGGANLLFLFKKLAELTEWMAFWR